MRVYISGPITGVKNYEKAFQRVEDKLAAMGHAVVNPCKLSHEHDKSWGAFMREDIKALMDCDAIALLPGWEDSTGARIEESIARALSFVEVTL